MDGIVVMRKRKRVRATTDHLSAQLSGACDGVEEFNHVSLDFQAKRRSEGRYRNQDRLAPATCTPPTRVEFETPRVRSSKAPSPGYIHHTTVEQFLQVYNSPFMPKRTYGRRQLKHRQITLAPAARLNSMITPIESPPLAKPYKMRRLPPKYNRKSSQIARGGTAPETSSAATKPTSRTKDIRRKTSTTTFNHRLAKAAISCDGDPLDTLVLPHNSGSALAQRRPLKFRPLDFSSAICRPSSSLEHVADTIPDPPFSKVCSSAANNGLTSSHIVGFKVPAGNSLVHVKRVGTQSRNAATFTSNRGGLRSKILQSNARQPLSFVSLLDSNNGINNGITHRKRKQDTLSNRPVVAAQNASNASSLVCSSPIAIAQPTACDNFVEVLPITYLPSALQEEDSWNSAVPELALPHIQPVEQPCVDDSFEMETRSPKTPACPPKPNAAESVALLTIPRKQSQPAEFRQGRHIQTTNLTSFLGMFTDLARSASTQADCVSSANASTDKSSSSSSHRPKLSSRLRRLKRQKLAPELEGRAYETSGLGADLIPLPSPTALSLRVPMYVSPKTPDHSSQFETCSGVVDFTSPFTATLSDMIHIQQ